MRKKFRTGILCMSAAVAFAGCGKTTEPAETTAAVETAAETEAAAEESAKEAAVIEGAVNIALSDDGITVDGEAISENEEDAVYAAHDIVYYEAGHDFTYGAGSEEDEHSKEDADAHTVIHITKAGTYALSGSISAGQVAVDLGEDAKEDPEAVVTLILNGVDINCSVAPGVIFYHVYECGSDDEETAVKDVDTSAAGANVIIADGTENNVTGSYVARIYKSVELNEEGTEVVSNKKLHKYDGAFYSKMSMNVDGQEEGTGILNIKAENEGLDSELHLTINGGNINIVAGNDGINTNEDNVSVTTVNGGTLKILVDGGTGEGDGIDSNGWLVINGGTVISEACSFSMDSGIDSDKGIHINGGTVIATGNMLDAIDESEQNYAVFSFDGRQSAEGTVVLKDSEGNEVISCDLTNEFSYLILSDEDMKEGSYTLWFGDTQLTGVESDGETMMFRPEPPEGFDPANMPEGFDPANMPKDFDPANMPEGFDPANMPKDFDPADRPEGGQDGNNPPERPEGGQHGGDRGPGRHEMIDYENLTNEFVMKENGSFFAGVQAEGSAE